MPARNLISRRLIFAQSCLRSTVSEVPAMGITRIGPAFANHGAWRNRRGVASSCLYHRRENHDISWKRAVVALSRHYIRTRLSALREASQPRTIGAQRQSARMTALVLAAAAQLAQIHRPSSHDSCGAGRGGAGGGELNHHGESHGARHDLASCPNKSKASPGPACSRNRPAESQYLSK